MILIAPMPFDAFFNMSSKPLEKLQIKTSSRFSLPFFALLPTNGRLGTGALGNKLGHSEPAADDSIELTCKRALRQTKK